MRYYGVMRIEKIISKDIDKAIALDPGNGRYILSRAKVMIGLEHLEARLMT